MRFDLHVHSRHSNDSLSGVKDIINRARQANIQGVSIVDHNSFAGSSEALNINPEDILIIPGAEYSTDQGHFLVYFLKEGLENMSLMRDSFGRFRWQEVVEAAHDQEALVFLAHPFKGGRVQDLRVWEYVDGLEVFNGRAALSRSKSANSMALDKVRALNKGFSAGSDGHWLSEIGRTFWQYMPDKQDQCVINSKDREGTLMAVRNALKSGNGRVWGHATCRLYEPASQIMKQLRLRNFSALPRPVVKMLFMCTKEFGRITGIEKKPLSGWIDVNP